MWYRCYVIIVSNFMCSFLYAHTHAHTHTHIHCTLIHIHVHTVHRGNSKYHYYGIRIKPDSPLNTFPQDDTPVVAMRQPSQTSQR